MAKKTEKKTVEKKIGIDVSYAQGKIDWAKVAPNIDFAIIRCGYGGDYTSQDDKQFEANIKGCEENGIPYGVYLYSYADNMDKVLSEARHVIRLLKGKVLDLPVFYDVEENKQSYMGRSFLLSAAKTFCQEIEKAGYQYGTYANKDWFSRLLTDSWYDSKVKWLAQYNKEVTYKGSYDIWQYSSTGKIDGINGNVDMNYCYVSLVKGDVNGDGIVTSSDARKILRVSAGLEELTGQEALNADVNRDGNTTAADAREALLDAAMIKE